MYDNDYLYNFFAVVGATVIFFMLCSVIFFIAMSLLG